MKTRPAFAAIALATASLALANGAEIGRDPAGIAPLASTDVQLVSEEVVIRTGFLWGEPGLATCRYHLRNLGPRARRLEVAFYVETLEHGNEKPRFGARHGFRVWQDGRELPVRVQAVDRRRWAAVARARVDSLPTWTMTIPAGGDSHLEMSYSVGWSGGGEHASHFGWGLTYHARPAGLWAGVIERATFEVRLDDATLADIAATRRWPGGRCAITASPPGFVSDGRTLRWAFADWDAGQDIRVSVDHRRPAAHPVADDR